MSRLGLLAWYAGLLAGAAAPDFSTAVPIRSAAVNPHHKILDTKASSLAQVATTITAEKKTEDCLPILNTLRTEGLNGLLKELVKADDGEVESIEPLAKTGGKSITAIASELAGSDTGSCEAPDDGLSKYSGLVITFDHSTKFDCEALISASFTSGLSHLEKANYNAATEDNTLGKAPLDNIAAKNVAAIVSKKATKVACAVTTNCTAGKNVLFCYFIEPLGKAEAKPIDAEVYEALLKRQRGSASITVPGITATLFSLALVLLS